ncbi:MAG TPA: hypothetical protein VF412_16090 [Bdellovibrio sp.]|uniref:hypothetical protein n=1 Tax=Bdellovibrio sp. TaxID=28201 RepID=UPI002F171757
MKTSKLVSALFISSVLGLAACTPRDVKVVDDQTRLRINSKKGGKTQKNGPGSEFKLGSYSMSAFLMEKQIEAVELIQLATKKQDAIKTEYTVTDLADAADGSKQLTIGSSKDELNYSSAGGDWKGKGTKSLNAKITYAADKIQAITISGSNVRSSVDSAANQKTSTNKYYVNLTETSYNLALTAKEDSTVVIEVNGTGNIAGAAGGKRAVSDFSEFKISMVVDKASLDTTEVKILSATAQIKYKGGNGKDFSTNLSGKNLALNLDGLCNTLVGSSTITSDRNKIAVSFDDKAVKVGNKWSQELAACGKRPVVDLSRLLVY